MKISCIYKISSLIKPERIYIGSSISFLNRKHRHTEDLKKGKHSSKKLQNHFNKYGKDDLVFEILEVVDNKDQLLAKEQFYLDNNTCYFNIAKIAGSRLGMKSSEETKRKLSETMKLRMIGNKNGIGNRGCLGKKLSDEHRKKIKDNHWTKNRKNEIKILLQSTDREN